MKSACVGVLSIIELD